MRKCWDLWNFLFVLEFTSLQAKKRWLFLADGDQLMMIWRPNSRSWSIERSFVFLVRFGIKKWPKTVIIYHLVLVLFFTVTYCGKFKLDFFGKKWGQEIFRKIKKKMKISKFVLVLLFKMIRNYLLKYLRSRVLFVIEMIDI